MKRLLLSALTAAALTCTASAVTALPAASGGQSFYISTTLSDTAGRPADPTIYNIGGNTYFKLRDLGRLLNFGVTYNHSANAVQIEMGKPYLPEPDESDSIHNTATSAANAIPTMQTLYLNGKRITPSVYSIRGNNYIGLRSFAALADFGVAYNRDNLRITAYAAYPYAEEGVWTAAMNDLTGNLSVLPDSGYPATTARYAAAISGKASADWKALISTLRAVQDAPAYAAAPDKLHRANLYWADRITAAMTGQAAAATPLYRTALTDLADTALFNNPDRADLQQDFRAMSSVYLGASPSALPQVSVRNGYAKNARSRVTLADSRTLTSGAAAEDVAAAKAYFAPEMARLSLLPTDTERVSFIYRLLQREYRTGGSSSWVTGYGKRSAVSARSLAAAADWMFAEAGIPAFPAQSWSTAWNVVYVNGQWAVFDFTKGSALRSLDDYRLSDTHPGSTLLLTQVMRPGASYYNMRSATIARYFTYTGLTGAPQATVQQMQSYLRKVNPNAPQSVLDMIPLYLTEGQAEGIRGDIAFAQSCLETGNFTFTGSAVSLEGNNFCGLGVLDNGMQGAVFATPQLGIRAQIQHLKAYANRQPLQNECIDPRFHLVTRGAAPTVQYLGIQENPQGYGWAAGADYGVKILNILENILTM